MIDDGSQAGEIVACPQCQHRFRMPGNSPAEMEFSFSPASSAISDQKRRSKSQSANVLLASSMALLAVIGLGVSYFASLYAKAQDDLLHGQSEMTFSWRERGFREGKAVGRAARNAGTGYDPRTDLWEQIGEKNPEAIQHFMTFKTPPPFYEIKPEYPQRNSSEYGDYTIGFEDGYAEGYFGP